jgi:hypothetical protein
MHQQAPLDEACGCLAHINRRDRVQVWPSRANRALRIRPCRGL